MASTRSAAVVVSTTPQAATSASARAPTSRGCGDELASSSTEVDVGGEPELEARYREWLPVVEIDGERAFVYYVDEALRRRLRRTKSAPERRARDSCDAIGHGGTMIVQCHKPRRKECLWRIV